MNRNHITPTGIVLTAAFVISAAAGLGWLAFKSDDKPATTSQPTTEADPVMPQFQVGDWQVGIAMDPPTPMVGNNRLIVELNDGHGNPATAVAIEAHAQMPAMGAMPTMLAPAGRLQETAPGHYEGELNLPMRGEWPLTVQILDHPQLGNRRLQFDLATDRLGLSIASGGTPVGGRALLDDEQIFSIDSRRRQLIGLKTETATHRNLVKSIRAVGQVSYDERLLSQVTLKYDGFIGDLYADYAGTRLEQGQILFTVYSPELLAAQQEYLETLKRGGSSTIAESLLHAARQRLALWDMSNAEIEALERRGVTQDYVPIYAPRSGTLIDRQISRGGGAPSGAPLLTIADLSKVWIEAEIYESDLQLVNVGTEATITLPYLAGQTHQAQVEYIYPYLHPATRTGKIRFTLDNAAGALKPDMYAEVTLAVELGHRLAIPEESVIIAGRNRVVFVDLGDGHLKPVTVETGLQAQGLIEIRTGLEFGDRVVTSGNFLVAAEARLKTGIQQW